MFDLILIIRIVILLIACSIAAYTDHKSGYIYNSLSYSLIIIALILDIFTFPFSKLLEVIGISVIIYLVGYLIYYLGKIGGGDIKLFIGINLILPYYFGQLFILWVLIFSSLFSVLIVSIIYSFKLYKKIKTWKNYFSNNWKKIIRSLVIFIMFAVMLSLSINNSALPKYFYLFLIPIFFGLASLVFEEDIKKYIYLRNKPVSKIEDGDILAIEYLSKALRLKFEKIGLSKRSVIEEEDLKKIRALKLRTIPIYDNLPRFGPYILLGAIFVLIIGKYLIF
ncbi:MAG: A24 family peptidase [archaeon]